MMGFTADGQANSKIVEARDKGYEISSEEKKQRRVDIPSPEIAEGADDWENGKAIQLEAKAVEVKK